MKLYHISYDIDYNSKKRFTPIIPESAPEDENRTVNRICLTDSIVHSIQATEVIPNIGQIITVYSKIIKNDDSSIVRPQDLFDSGFVRDALENHEYWYLKELIMNSKNYRVTDIDIEFDIAWTVIRKTDLFKIMGDICHKYKMHLTKAEESSIFNKKTIQGMYNAFHKCLNTRDLWDAMDDYYNTVAELPWAQIKRITKLQLEEVK